VERLTAQLAKCVNSGTMKSRWNACYAAHSALTNTVFTTYCPTPSVCNSQCTHTPQTHTYIYTLNHVHTCIITHAHITHPHPYVHTRTHVYIYTHHLITPHISAARPDFCSVCCCANLQELQGTNSLNFYNSLHISCALLLCRFAAMLRWLWAAQCTTMGGNSL